MDDLQYSEKVEVWPKYTILVLNLVINGWPSIQNSYISLTSY